MTDLDTMQPMADGGAEPIIDDGEEAESKVRTTNYPTHIVPIQRCRKSC